MYSRRQLKKLLTWKVYPSSVQNFWPLGSIEVLSILWRLKVREFLKYPYVWGIRIEVFKWKIWINSQSLKSHSRLWIEPRGQNFWILEEYTFHISKFFGCYREYIYWFSELDQVYQVSICKGDFDSHFKYELSQILATSIFHLINLEWNCRNKTIF